MKPMLFVLLLVIMASNFASGEQHWCTMQGYPCGKGLSPCCGEMFCNAAVIGTCCTRGFIWHSCGH
ncbi:hypothetical protein SOVF_141900 [Spinacia oleracea]|nr:hypothetical protein SOVF_141900 [Spinacia oleracea]